MNFIKQIKLFNKIYIKYNTKNRFKCSYTFGQSNEILSPLTIGQVIEKRSEDSSDIIACISQHQNIIKTYKQLNQDVNKLAKGLKSIGCEKGVRVGIWSANCYEWVVTQYATAKIGAIMVNVNPGYQAMELEYCLNLVGCHTLICSQKFKSTNYCNILEAIEPNILKEAKGTRIKSKKIRSLENIILINSSSEEEETAPKNLIRFSDFLSQFDGQTNVETSCDFDESINIQFTSGTTGRPKAATLTQHNLIQNAYFCSKRALEGLLDKTPVICLPPPLYHCFGSVVGSLVTAISRGTLVLPEAVHNPTQTLKSIHDFKCDAVYGTPTMFIDLLNSNMSKYNTSSIKRGFMSGSSCPKSLIQSVKEALPTCEHILIPYGTTECSPAVTFTSIQDSDKHQLESVGRPLDHLEIKIIDIKSGLVNEIGQPGEVCIRGHCTFQGYWNQQKQTDEVLDKNRWYHTGDIGVMDESGYISINGRIKEMIIRGGENIYPREIEDFLLTHDSVTDAQVVGVSDDRMGEELVAFIRIKNSFDVDSDALKRFCKGKISHFKIPKNFEFVDDFPRTVTGKIEKYKLKKLAEDKYVK